MADPDLGFNIITGPEWLRVAEALARTDEELPGRYRQSILDDSEALADEARARVIGLPTPRHAGHTGLRLKVAAGVHVVDFGERGGVRVVTSMPTPSEGVIPRGLDRLKGWRHPLFGDRSRWFSNPGYSWFLSTFSRGEGRYEKGLDKVSEDAAKKIADAGGAEI